MNSGPLPPVPGLIPIAALRKSSSTTSRIITSGTGIGTGHQPHNQVMGEQRTRRTAAQPSSSPLLDLIDTARSRGAGSAAPRSPSRKPASSSHRHRKSDRRRDHRSSHRKHSAAAAANTTANDRRDTSPERPANPRVNPIFVWVRQEDTRIVDVKCEDYDKRNRILLTKTAQGWRAIPRTETLVPSLKEAADDCSDRDRERDVIHHHHHHHHHHHRNRKSKKNKVRRKSASVQVDSDFDEPPPPHLSPVWDIESHLPSHKIQVTKRHRSRSRSKSPVAGNPPTPDAPVLPPPPPPSVNSAVCESAHAPLVKCSAGTICDVTPLDNLLAVAELEFNQQIQSGEWDRKQTEEAEDKETTEDKDDNDFPVIDDDQHKTFIENMEQLNTLLESCAKSTDPSKIITAEFNDNAEKHDDCDYTEDDDNNLAMDDILSRLEQSLRTPESTEICENIHDCDIEGKLEHLKEIECISNDINENNYKVVPEYDQSFFEKEENIDTNNTSMTDTDIHDPDIIQDPNIQESDVYDTCVLDTGVDQNVPCADNLVADGPDVERLETAVPDFNHPDTNVADTEVLNGNSLHTDIDTDIAIAEVHDPDDQDTNVLNKNIPEANFHDTNIPDGSIPETDIQETEITEFGENVENLIEDISPASEGVMETFEVDDDTTIEHIDSKNNEIDKTEENLIENFHGESIVQDMDENIEPTNIENNVENCIVREVDALVGDDQPTDLSIKSKPLEFNTDNVFPSNENDEPTDLSVPKNPSSRCATPRPPSQNSEAIQSPQPSGIPAVPPSPDIISPTSTSSKSKSVFLESLLSATSQKLPQSTEVTLVKQREPLDLGKCRKSASPTVSCSEEVKNNTKSVQSDLEPPAKRFKPNDITLKTLLDVDLIKNDLLEKVVAQETPRLLELLKTDTSLDPITQLKHVVKDPSANVPDPMLVPKDKLSLIISNPAKEIPRLLKQRPELRLPEALAYPNLLQDPDILVITLQQLETIIKKQNQALPLKDMKQQIEKHQERQNVKKPERVNEHMKEINTARRKSNEELNGKMGAGHELSGNKAIGGINELASDIDAATTAAFNQMMWLPYLNQLEAMSISNSPEMLKMLNGSVPMYPGQMGDLSHLLTGTRFPPPISFPMQSPLNYNNPLEMNMWQEAMLQANMLRPKVPFESLNPKHSFKDYLDKLNFAASAKKPPINNPKTSTSNTAVNVSRNVNNMFYQNHNMNNSGHSSYQNNFMNMGNAYQSSNSKHNMQVPQFNPATYSHKALSNMQSQQKSSSHSLYHKGAQMQQKYDNACNFSAYAQQQQRLEEKHRLNTLFSHQRHHQEQRHQHEMSNSQKPKLMCKSFASISQAKEKSVEDISKPVTSTSSLPIDLSGGTATVSASRLKAKQRLEAPPINNTTSKLMKHDDIPEVGSTTASIEEMQDAHKHLWHPLFGNQKGYTSPWNWTTVTATGE